MKKNKNDRLVSWIRSDAKLPEDNLEDKIMDRILQQPSMRLTSQKGINRSRDIIILAYCILTFIALTWCLLDNSIFIHFHIPDSNWQSMTQGQYVRYYWMSIIAAMLSILSFINHWMQSKKMGINRHSL
jgi:hypothetical protein